MVHHRSPCSIGLTRRRFLTSGAGGIGLVALQSLLQKEGVLAASPGGRVKNCIFLFMEGGASQFDLFSYKPKLNELAGKRPPEELLKNTRFAFVQKDTAVLRGSPSTFRQYGQSGMWFSNLVPRIAEHADKLCMLQAVGTSQFNHHPAQLVTQTGHNLNGHPALGAWLSYGLGSENQNLPAYVVMNSNPSLVAGETLWQSGFLPSSHQGVLLQPVGNPILNLDSPPGIPRAVERRGLDSVARLNAIHKRRLGDADIDNRTAAYEMAFRMQAEAPDLVDLSKESAATLERYGLERPDTQGTFARHCLLARRLVERGVRFVNVFCGSWDMHTDIDPLMVDFTRVIDQPVAALIADLEERGMFDDTLLVFATEFGRSPLGENRVGFTEVTGRDHHPDAFSMFMIGPGLKRGLTFGETDDIGWRPVRDAVDISDVHATILTLFGLDPMALSFRHDGLDQRLIPVTRVAAPIQQLFA